MVVTDLVIIIIIIMFLTDLVIGEDDDYIWRVSSEGKREEKEKEGDQCHLEIPQITTVQ